MDRDVPDFAAELTRSLAALVAEGSAPPLLAAGLREMAPPLPLTDVEPLPADDTAGLAPIPDSPDGTFDIIEDRHEPFVLPEDGFEDFDIPPSVAYPALEGEGEASFASPPDTPVLTTLAPVTETVSEAVVFAPPVGQDMLPAPADLAVPVPEAVLEPLPVFDAESEPEPVPAPEAVLEPLPVFDAEPEPEPVPAPAPAPAPEIILDGFDPTKYLNLAGEGRPAPTPAAAAISEISAGRDEEDVDEVYSPSAPAEHGHRDTRSVMEMLRELSALRDS